MLKNVLSLILLLFLFNCEKEKQQSDNGSVFGTSYSIIYHSSENYQLQFEQLFDQINTSMSTYIPNSIISAINRNENAPIDLHFRNVMMASFKIHEITKGAFDPTIGAVVNAWDFGPEGKIEVDSLKIDSLMQGVGLDKVKLNDDLIEKPQNTYLDFNAVAKGYAVDVIAEFLSSNEVENYLVEIGGEMRASGMNLSTEKAWTIGIDKPNFDGSQELLATMELKDAAMATSGVYRKFKIDESGKRYAHIINTNSGYPSETNVLSVSVIADNCMYADAYATAFQAMGIDNVKRLIKNHPELKVYFIFENEKGELDALSLNGFPIE